jgi:hypothetical protein
MSLSDEEIEHIAALLAARTGESPAEIKRQLSALPDEAKGGINALINVLDSIRRRNAVVTEGAFNFSEDPRL